MILSCYQKIVFQKISIESAIGRQVSIHPAGVKNLKIKACQEDIHHPQKRFFIFSKNVNFLGYNFLILRLGLQSAPDESTFHYSSNTEIELAVNVQCKERYNKNKRSRILANLLTFSA